MHRADIDTHVRMPDRLLKNNFDSNYALTRAIEIINTENYTIDCLFAGDLVEDGLEGEYAHLKQIPNRLNRRFLYSFVSEIMMILMRS